MAISRADCAALDAADPLRHLRDEFVLPDGTVYLVGNSLGAPPKRASAAVARVVEEEWGGRLVGAWNADGWFDLPTSTGDRLAPLIGAGPGQVVVGDTTSIAIVKAVSAALRLRPGRRVIVSDLDNFPTDRYMVQGLAGALGGYEIRDVRGTEGLDEALAGGDVACVLLSEVDYRTGNRHDTAEVTARVQAAGALMVWDLCHSAGAYQVDVSPADFAVGCTYKYLNGGPGSPAFVYVHPRHQADAEHILTGWHGHAAPFAFEPGYRPAEGVRRFAVSTPHVLSFASLNASLDIWERADLAEVRAKSVALTSLFIDLVEELCAPYGLGLVTSRDPERRGSQVSFTHPEGYPVMRALIDRGVHGDFRAPDILRFGFAPLYIRHVDVHDAAVTLAEVLEKEHWRDERYRRRLAVT
ncbi:kynureninase [Planomonospora parontospora subsp. parontospora]|uniref:Kynureninase n=2 Tax=Planomonospora parontospora TaxID=58119 RepID=A0AA37BNN8_9ACTN|nr:kynureninase [Planomonospora parontospora]GGK98372.1 kynureninase [Planomonospora parontospora]GII11908.1 kynureninase [Planomonospora parontospora subsp. parontospora]